MGLEEDPHGEIEFHPLTIGKTKSHIVVEYGIHIFDPKCVHGTIKDDPLFFRIFHLIYTHEKYL